MEMEKVARWAYIIFVVLAIVAGLAVGYMAWNANNTYPYGWSNADVSNINGYITLVLLILGVIVGLVSITVKEVTPFLVATIALIVASISNVWEPLTTISSLLAYWAGGIMTYIVAFAAPAAVLIAIKSVLSMTKEK